jgi:nitrilase
LLSTGGGFARAYGPDGSPLGEPLDEHAEGLLLVDIDLGLIALAKSAADPVGHYSRPDVMRLLLNRTPAPRVETLRPSFESILPIEQDADVTN